MARVAQPIPSRPAPAAWSAQSRAGLLARIAYVGILLLATLSPFDFQVDLAQIAGRLARALRLDYTAGEAVDAVRNVALFGGWGVLWVVTARRDLLRRAVRSAVLSGVALSASIEIVQSLTPERSTSLLDVLTNTAGSLAGAVLVVKLVESLQTQRAHKSYLGLPAIVFLGGYAVALTLDAAFSPSRLTPIAGVYGGPFVRLQAALADFRWASVWSIPVGDLLLYCPAGAFAVVALVELGWPYVNAVRLTVVASVLWWTVLEVGHGPLALPIQLGAILAHVAGVAVGAWVAARFVPALSREVRGRDRPFLFSALYVVLLMIWAWRPFVVQSSWAAVAEQFSLDRFVPLEVQAPQMDVFGVADIVEGFALYLPLGALLAVWPLKRAGYLGSCLPAIYLATLTELGQVFIAGRLFDMTDLLVEVAGVAIGWTVARYAGFAPHGEVLRAGSG